MTVVPLSTFAEDTQEASVQADATDESKKIPIEIGLVELRELFINNVKDVRDLKKNISDLGENVDRFDYMPYLVDRPSGMKDQRKGHYYEFAYPNLVQPENLKAQLLSLEVGREKLETTLSYSVDTMLSSLSVLNEQVKLYDKMVQKTKKTYEGILKKKELGTISEVAAETARVELDNLKYTYRKNELQAHTLRLNIMSQAGLEFDQIYSFPVPVFTLSDFDETQFGQYYETALSANKDVIAANRQMEALENEKKYVEQYEVFILKSDLLDFKRRYEEGQALQVTSKESVYTNLRTYLSEFYRLKEELNVAQTQIKYDENYLSKLKKMEALGQVVDTDRLSYEIKVFQSEIKAMSLKNEMLLLSQKIEMFTANGLKL
ncbi:hypothetical protein F3D3_2380 [Fusibacter sp. 3D3]|nr:hypothetical protein F3D3_2380 [Fusibacter sp. 3D3]